MWVSACGVLNMLAHALACPPHTTVCSSAMFPQNGDFSTR